MLPIVAADVTWIQGTLEAAEVNGPQALLTVAEKIPDPPVASKVNPSEVLEPVHCVGSWPNNPPAASRNAKDKQRKGLSILNCPASKDYGRRGTSIGPYETRVHREILLIHML